MCKGYEKMSLILQFLMQETDELIEKIKETLEKKNVCCLIIFNIYSAV